MAVTASKRSVPVDGLGVPVSELGTAAQPGMSAAKRTKRTVRRNLKVMPGFKRYFLGYWGVSGKAALTEIKAASSLKAGPDF